ncbi:MAG: hypothetical protein ACYTAN_11610 [Planctomycetota bacterium]|jgi:hypothetical protein
MSDNGYRKMSLTERVKKLETMLRCEYARGQVYLRNLIDPRLRDRLPQITLRCRIREYMGDGQCLLGLEQIVLTCCRNPIETCEAYRRFSERTAAG